MPTVVCSRRRLYELLGREMTDSQFDDLCFEFGIELDDITTEKEFKRKQGIEVKGEDSIEKDVEEVVYKIEVPANRYDLLCVEGIANALSIFLNLTTNPQYSLLPIPPSQRIRIVQRSPTFSTRRFVVGCVLRNVTFNSYVYNSFIDLQDKLHQNIGRKRTLISIGTHDIDTIKPPFIYDARPWESVKFVALGKTKEMDIKELFHHYKTTPNSPLAPYLHISEGFDVHPVIVDSNNTVCSIPPIVNSEHSKIRLSTRNVLIEATGTDATKLDIALHIVIAAFSRYCEKPFHVEPVEIVNETNGEVRVTPTMEEHKFVTSAEYINRAIGINLPGEEISNLLNRTQLRSTFDKVTQQLNVIAPISRADILHPCDVMEDVAIAYGYNNIKKTQPKTATVGSQLPINKLSDLNREVVAQSGFTEVLTWALCSHDENFKFLNREEATPQCVRVGNPKTAEFEIVRTSLLPGLLKALASNNGLVPLPIKIFEISDVSLLDSSYDVGSRNQRQMGALYCGTTSGYETIHGLVDRVMEMNGYLCQAYINDRIDKWEKKVAEKERKKGNQKEKKEKKGKEKEKEKEKEETKVETKTETAEDDDIHPFEFNPTRVYHNVASSNPTFFPGRRADVMVGDVKVATFGILHPNVLQSFGISFPCSACELNVEFFMDMGSNQKVKGTAQHKK